MRASTVPLVVVLLLASAPPVVGAAAPPRGAGEAGIADQGWMSGQPPRWRLALGPLAGYDFEHERAEGRLFLDAEGRLAMPQFGLLDTHIEGGLDFREGQVGTAAGLYAKLPYVRVGVERDFDDHRFDLVLSLQGSLRRGGMFHRGERLRLDWLPGRQAVRGGFLFNTPWMRYRATRPYRTHYDLPSGRPPAPLAADASAVHSAALERVEHAVTWLDRLLTPHLAPQGFSTAKNEHAFERILDGLLLHARDEGHDFAGEDSAYHAGLELAFAHAVSGDAALGRALAVEAERVILEEIVVPVDQHFATRRHQGGIRGLARAAQARFEQALAGRGAELSPPAARAAGETFRRVVARIDQVARDAGRRWRNSSLVWLPLNYGLRPEQYDSQAEVEAVIGRVLGRDFTGGNEIRYVLNDQFVYELRNTIRATRHYHVLWVHDFRGFNARREPDRVAWSQATEGYIEAMTAAVEALDRGERDELPVFLLFLDEHYYQVNRSRRLISLLEDLSTADAPSLGDSLLDARLDAALSRLQETVRRSPALAARGPAYVKKRVRVQVHITYPLDPAYAGDILMRDHRKLAFRDVVPDDPQAGVAIFTGEGVGEHYQGPHWEDRSLVVRGPELERLREAARRLLLSQDFREREIPACLRAPAAAPLAGAGNDAGGDVGARLLTAFNDTGWGAKPATILKATLYNLMPRGSLLIAPDSLWTSDFWAGMFIMAALRGCQVYVIAPEREHAPSNSLPTMGLMHETLALLWTAGERMKPDLARRGGTLSVGLYARESDVSDMRALCAQLLAPPAGTPALLSRESVHPAVVRALEAEVDTLARGYPGPRHPFDLPPLGKPQIHLKAQFFASKEALGVFAREEWGPIAARWLAIRRRQTLAPGEAGPALDPDLLSQGSPLDSLPRDLFARYRASLRAAQGDAAERALCFATIGSPNPDRRSMLFDGGVLVGVSGSAALTSAIDFGCLLATAKWPSTRAELDAAYPESSSLMKKFRRWIQNLI
jgi:hypothetical protein